MWDICLATEKSLLGNNFLLYLVTNKLEQLNENGRIQVPVGNLVDLASTQNCLALPGLFARTVLCVIQMFSV